MARTRRRADNALVGAPPRPCARGKGRDYSDDPCASVRKWQRTRVSIGVPANSLPTPPTPKSLSKLETTTPIGYEWTEDSSSSSQRQGCAPTHHYGPRCGVGQRWLQRRHWDRQFNRQHTHVVGPYCCSPATQAATHHSARSISGSCCTQRGSKARPSAAGRFHSPCASMPPRPTHHEPITCRTCTPPTHQSVAESSSQLSSQNTKSMAHVGSALLPAIRFHSPCGPWSRSFAASPPRCSPPRAGRSPPWRFQGV